MIQINFLEQNPLFLVSLVGLIGLSLSAPEVKLSKYPVLLVVSFDGFRIDYLTDENTPNLKALQNEGVKVPYMQPQFPTKTFPNHQSIVTGLYPDTHGITDNVVYDPLYQRNLSGFNDDLGFWNFHPEVLPFWIRNEQAGDDRYSGCYMWPGSGQGYGESNESLVYPTHFYPTYDESITWESRVETVISWMTNDTKPANIVFLYHNEPDSHGHYYGTTDNETIEEIKQTDNRAAYLIGELKNAQIYEQINLIFLSDHGMDTVGTDRLIDTTQVTNRDLYDRTGSTPVFHIQPKNNTDLQMIYDAFKADSISRNFSIYKKEELTELHFVSNRRISDLILIADAGFGFEDVRLNDKGVYGVHGYDNRSPSMRTLFIARGPVFKKGFSSTSFVRNIDLFPLFSKIMGVPEASNNGTLENVLELLASDTVTSTSISTDSTQSSTNSPPTQATTDRSGSAKLLNVNISLLMGLIVVISSVL